MTESLTHFMKSSQDGLYVIGHASALVRIAGKLFLIDPVWNHAPYCPHWFFAPAQVNCDDILDLIDGVFISHIHEDHLCEQVLYKTKGSVMLMIGRPNLEERINKVKMTACFRPFIWFTLEDHVEIMFVSHAFNSIDSSMFIRNKKSGFTIYHGNDNFLSRDLLEKIKSLVSQVDIAMVPYSFIHWYPSLLDNLLPMEKMKESARLNKQSLDQAYMFMEYMQPKYVIPTGSSLQYRGGKDHVLNRSISMPHDLNTGIPLLAGDWIMEDSTHSPPMDQWQYMNMLSDAHEMMKPQKTDVFSVVIEPQHIRAIEEKLKLAKPVPNHEIIVNGIVIDTEKLTVHASNKREKPYTEFTFESAEFQSWLQGRITFEQAIGTRRFRCIREPNIYNVNIFEFMNNYL